MSPSAGHSAYPVALLRDLHPHMLARARLCGIDLVIWQSSSGIVQVWEDRCPHRSVRLSAGRHRGDGLQCCYHGWIFDTDGLLRDVPAGIDGRPAGIKGTVRVKTLSSRVAHGLIWASIDDDLELPDGFAPGETDVLLRPVSVEAPPNVVAAACFEIDDMALLATPCDERTSVIYGYVSPVQNTSELDRLRACNHRLKAMRRRIEEAAAP